MYRIVLKNVGKDMVNRDVAVDTLNIDIAVLRAHTLCLDILGKDRVFVFSVVGEEISIKIGDTIVGSLTITKLR